MKTPVRIALLAVAALATRALAEDDGARVLQWQTMATVVGPLTGTANPIRGVPGGGLPWTLTRAQGTLRADGRVDVEVRGLVLADDPAVPAQLRLTNPIPSFRAIVSCVTVQGGAVTTASAITDPFPASTGGDARIDAAVELPRPCIAPIVFVTSPSGAWFAATGR